MKNEWVWLTDLLAAFLEKKRTMPLRAKSYFKDYEYEETTDKNGKVKKRYIYKGDYFERDLSEKGKKTERYLELIFSAVGIALSLSAMTADTPANYWGFFSMVSILNLIPIFSTFIGSVVSFFKKGNLTRGDYEEHLILLRIMPITATVLLIVMVAGYLKDVMDGGISLYSVLMTSGAVVIFVAISVHEIRTGYKVHKGVESSGLENKSEEK